MKNDIQKVVDNLIPLYTQSNKDLSDQPLWNHPKINRIHEIQQKIINLLFPGRCIKEPQDMHTFFLTQISNISADLKIEILKALPYNWIAASNLHENIKPIENLDNTADDLILDFINTIPSIRKNLITDVEAAYNGDPAALSYAEVKLAYPGLTAITAHRISHELYKLNIPLIPRMMSENIHSITGIDIHPGATIGKGFFIDHGTGVVIGETTKIGDNVKLYQGVTLGAKSFPLDKYGRPIKHIQRHPTVEDDVIIYANSTILGGDTIIGKRTVIAGNVFLINSTPSDSLVTRAESGVQIRTRSATDMGAGI
mgnify:FL=1